MLADFSFVRTKTYASVARRRGDVFAVATVFAGLTVQTVASAQRDAAAAGGRARVSGPRCPVRTQLHDTEENGKVVSVIRRKNLNF